mgnify:CR=1 FL=1
MGSHIRNEVDDKTDIATLSSIINDSANFKPFAIGSTASVSTVDEIAVLGIINLTILPTVCPADTDADNAPSNPNVRRQMSGPDGLDNFLDDIGGNSNVRSRDM